MRSLALAAAVALGALLPGGRASAGESAALATAAQMQLAQNELRYAAGAPTVPSDARLAQAAQSHASYSAINGTGGHYETAGLPGYTGYAPRDRALAAGFSATFVSEVATGASDAVAGVRSLWDAPYHRLGMIHPNAYTVPTPTTTTSFHSQWVTESQWPTVAVGETTTLSVTFRNAGATAWTKGSAYEARLGVNGDDRTFATLGMSDGWPIPDRPAVQDLASVPSGATTSFTFRVRGVRPGTFSLHLRPVIDGITWMEDEGVYMVVTVR